MEGEGDNGQPSLKKIKLDNDLIEESIFKNFKKDEEKLSDLQYAVTALNEGYNRMNFILIKFIEANARSSARFTKATCDTAQYDGEVFVAASIFLKGIDVLEQYILSDRIKVPSDDRQRKALNKLLKFLSEGMAESLSPFSAFTTVLSTSFRKSFFARRIKQKK